ncbi:hypothetical protein RFI_33843, partial [Reticulomyxa filosa]
AVYGLLLTYKIEHKYEEKADRNEKVYDMTTVIEQKVNEPVKSILANDDNKNKEENANTNANYNEMTTNNKSSCMLRQIYIYFNKIISNCISDPKTVRISKGYDYSQDGRLEEFNDSWIIPFNQRDIDEECFSRGKKLGNSTYWSRD